MYSIIWHLLTHSLYCVVYVMTPYTHDINSLATVLRVQLAYSYQHENTLLVKAKCHLLKNRIYEGVVIVLFFALRSLNCFILFKLVFTTNASPLHHSLFRYTHLSGSRDISTYMYDITSSQIKTFQRVCSRKKVHYFICVIEKRNSWIVFI